MVIVECGMCYDLHNIEKWIDTDIFICQICVKIIIDIEKEQIIKNIKYSEVFSIALFDIERERIRNNK